MGVKVRGVREAKANLNRIIDNIQGRKVVRAIQSALDELQKNRTSLVIAHRLSTIEQADEIVVVEDGVIVERGSHADLLAHRGVYAQLHKMQFGQQ